MHTNWQFLMDNLPFLLPLILLELLLMIMALVHVLKHPYYRFGNRILWVIIVVVIQIIGPVVYFAFGRGEDQ